MTQIYATLLTWPHGAANQEDRQMDYIDVRGPWPLFVRGLIVIELTEQDRSITVEHARELLGL